MGTFATGHQRETNAESTLASQLLPTEHVCCFLMVTSVCPGFADRACVLLFDDNQCISRFFDLNLCDVQLWFNAK